MIAQLDSKYIRLSLVATVRRLLSYLFFEGRPLTTKGRWINPAVFALFSIETRLPQMKKVDRPTFILGTGRSGTTVLGVIFSMHREVGFLNEPKAMWHTIYPKEDLIGSYSSGEANYRLSAEDATPSVVQRANRLFGAYSAATFSARILDKYPELIFRIPFVKAIYPDAKFVFLVRNGWDTCLSIDTWSKRLGSVEDGATHDWWGVSRRKWNLLIDQIVVEHADLAPYVDEMRAWTSHVDMAAVEWIVTMREGMRLQRQYPNDLFRITYEDMCNNPRPVLTNACQFMGLPTDDEKFFTYATQILRPDRKAKKEVQLNRAVLTAFELTMKELGYT